MRSCHRRKSYQKESIICLVALNVITTLGGCSHEISEDDTPYPISPRTAYEQALENQPNASTPNRAKSSSSSVIQSPSVQCKSSVTRSDAGANESSQNSALVRLAANPNLQDPILVYRLPGTIVAQGSLLFVNDMSFGPEGTHVAGAYIFEMHTTDGQACILGVVVTDDDAVNKKILTIQASFP